MSEGTARLTKLKANHFYVTPDHGRSFVCFGCRLPWPCDTSIVLQELESLRTALRECVDVMRYGGQITPLFWERKRRAEDIAAALSGVPEPPKDET